MDIKYTYQPVIINSAKYNAKKAANIKAEKVKAEKENEKVQMLREESMQRGDLEILDDGSPAAQLHRFHQSTDEMSAALRQFLWRRTHEKNSGDLSESFERILDEDVFPKINALLKEVASLQEGSIENLLRHAHLFFMDDSDLVLVLREVLKRRNLDELIRKRLLTLLKHVEATADPRRLKAGINTALKARLFGKALNINPALIRQSYRYFLESDAREIEIYQEWIISYGYQKRAAIVDFMEGALLTDIDSQDPSCSRHEFGNLLGKLGQLKLLRSSDALFIKKILGIPLVRTFNDSEKSWLLFMLCILQDPDDLDDFLTEVVGERTFFSQSALRSSLLQVIYRACKSLPLELFIEPGYSQILAEKFEKLAKIAYDQERIEHQRTMEQHEKSAGFIYRPQQNKRREVLSL
ncbi:type III secretion regulator YopN/LcrE/InvE/MxiC [Candidatus Regiella insecticola 5.15]|uniref:Type III secretion regulator YopN/LcrE/InvE/MxiC n=1 Tax=Candidatus Regiella insecticola 5.15 TaxID=1005043 RepID=G2GYS9_9ENTR|nr:type III secretion system gatekeeper subunit SctW [Candidatus Regiella insecticola]EGY29101.1 type III secretion regulator YopN/LcrE/InvE/MxiC [Candidatus Regiella insecticola 5.15]